LRISTKTAFTLCLLGLALRSSAAETGSVRLQCEKPLPSSLCEEGARFWSELEGKFGPAAVASFRVVLVNPSTKILHAGFSRSGLIQIHPGIPLDSRLSVLKHELAHQYLSVRKGEASGFLHEAFALWTSQDDVRISLENSDFFRRKEALAFLDRATRPSFAIGGREDRALARVLVSLRAQKSETQKIDAFFSDFLRSDEKADEEALRSAFQIRTPKNRTDFALWDGAGRLLTSEGEIGTPFPTGSILKPLLLLTEPKIMDSRPSRLDPVWFCPEQSGEERLWTWQEALVKSCNGFFLDGVSSRDRLRNFATVMSSLGLPPLSSISEAIGLVPSKGLSLQEVEKIYRWLSLKSPFLLETLKRVPSEGTLAGLPDSQWFISHEIALKTGSFKDENGEPLHSWIVAVEAKNPSSPRFVVVLHSEGKSTQALLSELRTRLSPWMWRSEQRAKVRILGLIDEEKIHGRCASEPMLVRDSNGEWKVAAENKLDRTRASEFRCLSGPLLMEFPYRPNEIVTRPTYGVLSYHKISSSESASLPLRREQKRARSGSAWLLETSEREYLFQVVASEFAEGRKEAWKALALVARSNLRVGWKNTDEICDTTICQVFGQADRLNPREQKKLWQALQEVQKWELQNPKSEWLFFSAGGSQAWSESRSAEEVREALGGRSPGAVGEEDLQLQLRLPGRPRKIEKKDSHWIFEGRGRGHGKGFDVLAANALAAQGRRFDEILEQMTRWKVHERPDDALENVAPRKTRQ
jgi:hypothetical protein